MYSSLQLAFKYLNYFFTSKNGKGHGVHSPFVYDFITHVLNDKGDYYCYDVIEFQRKQWANHQVELEVMDMGAGSRKDTKSKRKVSDIALYALKRPKFSQLLFRLANHYKANQILELGTSLGITTAYLASASHTAKVITLEGVPAIADIARKTFSNLQVNHIELLEGNFDDTLPMALSRMPGLDFAYLDGNHRYDPTMRYFNAICSHISGKSIIVLDDIYWSKEMEEAWHAVKNDPRVMLTIDLFYIGIVFFSSEFKTKQHFKIHF